jgi:hypothetical protein
MLNWRPVVDLEIRAIEFERRKILHEKRMSALASEIERIESDCAQLRNENAVLDAINSRLACFERLHLSNSTPPPCTDDSLN